MDVPCVLCSSKEDDVIIFGKVHKKEGLVVHCNCLYLSSKLIQNGDENAGILNFLKKDILAEVRRCQDIRCFYCHQRGATIGCCHAKCRRSFHTKCGADNLTISEFCGSFKSYCHQHIPKYRYRPEPAELCMICFESLVADGQQFSLATSVQSPCCRNGWYHRQCLQKYANSAGYFFNCPLCKDEEKFFEVSHYGIFIPNNDASWELEPDAFADQSRRDYKCTAENCQLQQSTTGLLYCIMCGSNPKHTACTTAKVTTYRCADCIGVSPTSTDIDDDEEEVAATDDVFDIFAQREFWQPDADPRRFRRRQCKLTESMRSVVDSDDDDDDDDAFFEKVADMQSRQLIANRASEAPGTSASFFASTSSRSSTSSPARLIFQRTRETTASAQMLEQNENRIEPGARKRQGSRSPIRAPTRTRLSLQPISPRAAAARSNVDNSESARRRRTTTPTSNPRYDDRQPSNLDESCVANRTRTRLPSYMANKK